MDRIEPVATAPQAEQQTTVDGVGSTFRAVASGTSTERRRRSVGGSTRAGRSLQPEVSAGADSGTWRLAL